MLGLPAVPAPAVARCRWADGAFVLERRYRDADQSMLMQYFFAFMIKLDQQVVLNTYPNWILL